MSEQSEQMVPARTGRPLQVNASELLRRPGAEKRIELQVTIAEVGLVDDRFAPESPVDIDLHLEALSDGIVVDGEIRAHWHAECRRCLRPIDGDLSGPVHELYQREVTDEEAFPIVGDVLDLGEMVREVLLIDAPAAPLCRPDCAGICPTCGKDLNEGPCDCPQPVADPRWSALDQLAIDPDQSP
jgi:uncharacterized protein